VNISYYFEDGENEHSLECDVDYTPFSRGSFERGGLQIEPDRPEAMEVLSAKLNGIEILALLSPVFVKAIEQKAWDKIADEQQEYDEW